MRGREGRGKCGVLEDRAAAQPVRSTNSECKGMVSSPNSPSEGGSFMRGEIVLKVSVHLPPPLKPNVSLSLIITNIK